MDNKDKIKTAIEIFRAKLPQARGKFRAYPSSKNTNEIDVFNESGLYCTININYKTIKHV